MSKLSLSSAPRVAATEYTQVLTRAPSEKLRPYIRRYLIVESMQARRDIHLPDTGAAAAFCLRGDCLLDGGTKAPATAITGIGDTVRTHHHSKDHAVVIVMFTATGAGALLRQPLHELGNATADLDAVLGSSAGVDRLREALINAGSHERRILQMEDFLLRRIGDTRPDPLCTAATALIEREQGLIRIEELANQVGLSQSALERRFRKAVGVSPRWFASLVRLHHAARLRRAGCNLTTAAHAAGYYDQSHFIKDFKRIAGVPPSAFF